MRPKIIAVVADAAVLLAWAFTPALGHAAAPTYVTARVEVEASQLEGEGSTMEKSVASLSRNEVQQAMIRDLAKHVTVVDKGGEAVVHVSLAWKDYETSHYGVSVEIRRGNTARLVVVDECKLCDEEKLAAKVAGRVEDLLPYLAVEEVAAAVVEPESEVKPEVEPDASEPIGPTIDDRASDDPKPRPIGALGIAGTVVGAGGLAGLIYGGVLLSRGTTTSVDDDDERFELQESFARPGRIWLGVGLGTAAVGAAMVAIDLTVLRKRRAKRMAMYPSVAPGFTGATVRVRF